MLYNLNTKHHMIFQIAKKTPRIQLPKKAINKASIFAVQKALRPKEQTRTTDKGQMNLNETYLLASLKLYKKISFYSKQQLWPMK
jgi:hypothetical protein